jgi:mono/diheme cytochrome c family protein
VISLIRKCDRKLDTAIMNRITNARLCLVTALSAVGATLVASAQDATVLEHMHEHYDAMLKIQSAVIAGSLEDTHEPSRWLTEHQTPAGLPAGWEGYVDAMRTAARDTLNAQDVASAASATSRLGLACGGCHVSSNVSVEFESVARPPDSGNPRAHMQRHQWAADRMWEGLIGPSSFSWSRGANLLFESPMKLETVGAEAQDEALLGMTRRIHQLAANATAVSDPIERADIYAEFLANCAACHNAVSAGPPR